MVLPRLVSGPLVLQNDMWMLVVKGLRYSKIPVSGTLQNMLGGTSTPIGLWASRSYDKEGHHLIRLRERDCEIPWEMAPKKDKSIKKHIKLYIILPSAKMRCA